MTVRIQPEEFTLVFFDGGEIRALVERLVAEVGLPVGVEVEVVVDETTPMGRARLTGTDPVRIELESGALEDVKRPRHLSPAGAADVLGRLLFEARDRLDPGFGDPPAEADLTLQQSAAWQVHCVGRLHRLGYAGQRQRRRYQFRTRHGFTDDVDAAFDRLWKAEALTWAEIDAISEQADTRAAAG